MKKLLIIFSILFYFSNTYSQVSNTITGSFKDSSDAPAIAVEVILLNLLDSSQLFTMTDGAGSFEFDGITTGNYYLSVNSLEYQNWSSRLTVEKNMDLGTIILNKKANILKTVVVEGQAQQIMQKSDTSEYNANAFKVNVDASAEDLIKKMPGIDISSGTPKAQGEEIRKVIVDGKPFFGEDAGATLRNLPAEVIGSIQVYDERSEQSMQSGFDDGQTTKTLNIVTRGDKKNGTFGRVYAGYGLPEYYNAGLVFNNFKNNRRLSVLAQSNNINILNFSPQDLGGGGSGGGGGRRGGGGGGGMPFGMMGGGNDMTVNNRNGITNTNAIGINYSNVFRDKIKLSGSYFFNNGNNRLNENVFRTFVNSEFLGQTYQEDNNSTTNDYNHRANLRLEYQIDSFNYLMISPSIRLQNTNSENVSQAATLNNVGLLSSSNSNLKNKFSALNTGINFLYNHKFKKEGRTISLWNNTNYNVSEADAVLRADNIYADTTNNYFIDQQSLSNNNGWTTYNNLNYTEPLTSKIKMQLNAGIRYQYSNNDKQTNRYNAVSNEYNIMDTLLSNKFESKYTTPFGGLALGYNDSVWMINAGVNYQKATLENDRILPSEFQLNRAFSNWLPFAAINYSFTKRKQLRVRFRTMTNAPSVSQLQDVIDNTNPLILRTGNPNLNQTQEYRFFTNYRSSSVATNTNFFIMAMGHFVNDYIANATTIASTAMVLSNGIILQPGMQYITQTNLDGYYRLHSYASYGMPIKLIKSNLNVNGSYTQIRTPGLINNATNFALNKIYNLGITLSSNISEKLDFTLISQSNYSDVKNTLNTRANNSFFNQNSRFDINYVFFKNFFVNSSVNHQYLSGVSSGFNQNFVLWNAAIGTKFLKGNAGEIKLSVYDLLNQNQAVQRTFTELYTQDTRTNVLQQYFMLTFTYSFRHFKGGSEKDFEKKDEGEMMMTPFGPRPR